LEYHQHHDVDEDHEMQDDDGHNMQHMRHDMPMQHHHSTRQDSYAPSERSVVAAAGHTKIESHDDDDKHDVIMAGGAAGGFYYPGGAGQKEKERGGTGRNIGEWQEWPNVNIPQPQLEARDYAQDALRDQDGTAPPLEPVVRKQHKKLQALLVHTARYIAEFDKPPRLLSFTVSVHFLRYIFVPLLSPLFTLLRTYTFDSPHRPPR